jgi:hypothetical protein
MKLKMEREGKLGDPGTPIHGIHNEFNNAGVNTMINVYEHINTLISKKQRLENNQILALKKGKKLKAR